MAGRVGTRPSRSADGWHLPAEDGCSTKRWACRSAVFRLGDVAPPGLLHRVWEDRPFDPECFSSVLGGQSGLLAGSRSGTYSGRHRDFLSVRHRFDGGGDYERDTRPFDWLGGDAVMEQLGRLPGRAETADTAPGASRNKCRLDAGDRQDDRGRRRRRFSGGPGQGAAGRRNRARRPAPPTRATSSCRPRRASGKWITIRTSNMAGLPKEGTRVSPQARGRHAQDRRSQRQRGHQHRAEGRLLSADRPGGHGRADA